jgi:hypothetical protein
MTTFTPCEFFDPPVYDLYYSESELRNIALHYKGTKISRTYFDGKEYTHVHNIDSDRPRPNIPDQVRIAINIRAGYDSRISIKQVDAEDVLSEIGEVAPGD